MLFLLDTVPSDSRYSEVELRLDEMVICSDVMFSSFDKQEWCKVTRNSDLCSATIQNKRYVAFLWINHQKLFIFYVMLLNQKLVLYCKNWCCQIVVLCFLHWKFQLFIDILVIKVAAFLVVSMPSKNCISWLDAG